MYVGLLIPVIALRDESCEARIYDHHTGLLIHLLAVAKLSATTFSRVHICVVSRQSIVHGIEMVAGDTLISVQRVSQLLKRREVKSESS